MPVVGVALSAVPKSALNVCVRGSYTRKISGKIQAHTTSACKSVMSFKTAEMPNSLFVFTVTGDKEEAKDKNHLGL